MIIERNFRYYSHCQTALAIIVIIVDLGVFQTSRLLYNDSSNGVIKNSPMPIPSLPTRSSLAFL